MSDRDSRGTARKKNKKRITLEVSLSVAVGGDARLTSLISNDTSVEIFTNRLTPRVTDANEKLASGEATALGVDEYGRNSHPIN